MFLKKYWHFKSYIKWLEDIFLLYATTKLTPICISQKARKKNTKLFFLSYPYDLVSFESHLNNKMHLLSFQFHAGMKVASIALAGYDNFFLRCKLPSYQE